MRSSTRSRLELFICFIVMNRHSQYRQHNSASNNGTSKCVMLLRGSLEPLASSTDEQQLQSSDLKVIRLHTEPLKTQKALNNFSTYAAQLPNTCKHTLMYKISAFRLQGFLQRRQLLCLLLFMTDKVHSQINLKLSPSVPLTK